MRKSELSEIMGDNETDVDDDWFVWPLAIVEFGTGFKIQGI